MFGAILINIFFIHYVVAQDCKIIVPDLGRPDPLYLNIDNSLRIPFNGEIILQNREQIKISCASTSDSLLFWLQCINGRFLIPTNENIDLQNFTCPNDNDIVVEQISAGCRGNELHYQIGFRNPQDQVFISYIDICYNQQLGTTASAEHVVFGQSIGSGDKMLPINPPTWSRTGIPGGINIARAYEKRYQLDRFTEIFGSRDIAEKYIDLDNKFLAKGHLSPNADAIFASWTRATYLYINSVPQWQAVNNGNWKTVEESIRYYADTYNISFQVKTGTYRFLYLENHLISLAQIGKNDVLFVPMWIYKIFPVAFPDGTSSEVAIFTLNNPYATELPQPTPCQDQCETYEDIILLGPARTRFSHGYTICCQVNNALKDILQDQQVDSEEWTDVPPTSCPCSTN